MTIQRMDNVLIVVDDLEAAKAFFAELGMAEPSMGAAGGGPGGTTSPSASSPSVGAQTTVAVATRRFG